MRSKSPELMERICKYINQYYRLNHRVPTQREISAAMGIALSSVNRYLVAMNERGMITFDRKIASTPQISKCPTEYFSAPLVGSIQCGDPEEEESQVEEYINLPVSIFGKGNFYILRAKGRSMVDAGISPGDLVVIRKQNTADVGDIVVALDDENQNTLKRFAGYDAESKMAVLRYENESEYPGKEILVKNLVVQGITKHVIKEL